MMLISGVDRARLGETIIDVDRSGYAQSEQWAAEHGELITFGVEGTGSYGAGLASFLRRRGHRVVEVNRPDRRIRHLHGKDDPIDAESAVPSVLSGVPTATPESADGTVEMIRQIKIAKDTAVKSRSQAIITLKTTVIVNAPTERAVYYRGEVSSLDNSTLRLIREQKGRCPHCGEYLLRVDRELASPREWEQWLAATAKRSASSI
jgi:hypothetical protein